MLKPSWNAKAQIISAFCVDAENMLLPTRSVPIVPVIAAEGGQMVCPAMEPQLGLSKDVSNVHNPHVDFDRCLVQPVHPSVNVSDKSRCLICIYREKFRGDFVLQQHSV